MRGCFLLSCFPYVILFVLLPFFSFPCSSVSFRGCIFFRVARCLTAQTVGKIRKGMQLPSPDGILEPYLVLSEAVGGA